MDIVNASITRGRIDRSCNKTTVTLQTSQGPITCEGLEFHSTAGEAMVVHRAPWNPKLWQVTEPTTGTKLITNGFKTRSAAMENALLRVNKRPGCLAEAVRLYNLAQEVTP